MQKKSITAQTIKELQEQLQIHCTRLDESDTLEKDSVLTEVESTKHELHEIEEEAANKIIFCSKCKWARLGEKPTKYFLNLEKQKSKEKQDRTLSSVLADGDSLLLEPKNLYTENTDTLTPISEVLDSMQTLNHPTLTEVSREQLEAPLTLAELKNALSKLNKNKSPGTDSLPPEYYMTFWEHVGTYIHNSFMHSFNEGCLSVGQRRGVITLIPKKGVDRRKVANWRPITLLNGDYRRFDVLLTRSGVLEPLVGNSR